MRGYSRDSYYFKELYEIHVRAQTITAIPAFGVKTLNSCVENRALHGFVPQTGTDRMAQSMGLFTSLSLK